MSDSRADMVRQRIQDELAFWLAYVATLTPPLSTDAAVQLAVSSLYEQDVCS